MMWYLVRKTPCIFVVVVQSLSHVGLFWDPMDCSLPGSSVHGILHARILEWVAVSSSSDLPDPGIEPEFLSSPALAGGFFTTTAMWEAPIYM